jgi:threonine synthase
MSDQFADEVPDHLFVQVGGGALLTSLAMGVLEAAELGRLLRAPSVWAVQAEGCAPFDRAWNGMSRRGSVDDRLDDAQVRAGELMTPWTEPSSSATGILDDVTYDWLGVARGLLETGGDSLVVGEDAIREANQRVTSAGYEADETGTAGYAGLTVAMQSGRIDSHAGVGVLITGIRR